jgi:Ca2+-transporting ATPase
MADMTSKYSDPNSDPDPWHSLTYEKTLESLGCRSTGLTSAEAERRLRKHGPNTIQHSPPEGILDILFRQLNNPLVFILLGSTALAVLMGKPVDGIVILTVVILNTLIGFIQEHRAGRTIQALLTLVPETVTVLRDKDEKIIHARDLVPGDWVILGAGDRVSADLRIVEAHALSCDESVLTGESVPTIKQTAPVPPDSLLGDRSNMAFSGTLVTSGTGTGIVVSTGNKTEFGKISDLLESTTTLETPLVRSLRGIARWITGGTLLVGASVFGVGLIRECGWLESAFSAVTLAVAAIPEGLPAVITIASAIGVRRMAKRRAIIRHLPAVETLGSTSVICSDKTGTLTRNELTVHSFWTSEGEVRVDGALSLSPASEELLRAGVLCNDASLEHRASGEWKPVGDPTEVALVASARKFGMDEDALRTKWPRIHELPFDSGRKVMATLHELPERGARVIYLKGAPETVARLCMPKENLGLEEQLQKQIMDFARRGMRIIAIAKKHVSSSHSKIREKDLRGPFEFLGLQGMSDPPRPEVKEAIQTCHAAGITVKMITGDHPETARAIALDLGVIDQNHKVITGSEIASTSSESMPDLVEQHHVFARVAPDHKLKLVEALQARGQVVAMTGDGVNDAPALKRADIGVAMGRSGTAVAKEASDMVLADDNFESIEAAVEEGRRVYDNLVKSVAFILPTSIGQALIVLVGVLLFPVANGTLLDPMEPVQVLWVNLIVAITLALPLSFEAMEPDVMNRPPRRSSEPIIGGFILGRTLLVSVLMAGGAVGLFLWEYRLELARGAVESAAIAEAQTLAVTAIVLFQIFYLWNCRSLRHSVLKIGVFSNRWVFGGISLALLAQVGFVHLPVMNRWFHTAPLRLDAWVLSTGVAFMIIPIMALEKWIRARLRQRTQKRSG